AAISSSRWRRACWKTLPAPFANAGFPSTLRPPRAPRKPSHSSIEPEEFSELVTYPPNKQNRWQRSRAISETVLSGVGRKASGTPPFWRRARLEPGVGNLIIVRRERL